MHMLIHQDHWSQHMYPLTTNILIGIFTGMIRRKVLPVLKALQGHPEAGKCWEAHINGNLTELGFKLTTRGKTIYTKAHNGETVDMLRHVETC